MQTALGQGLFDFSAKTLFLGSHVVSYLSNSPKCDLTVVLNLFGRREVVLLGLPLPLHLRDILADNFTVQLLCLLPHDSQLLYA